VDTGPLKAILDRNEPSHHACVEALKELSGPLLTAWPVFTEAMHLLRPAGGWRAQEKLWEMHQRQLLTLVDLPSSAVERARNLMSKYSDVPMSLADATLVALAELRNIRRIFTLDSDFILYRFRGRSAFQLIPSISRR
jgi:predicted nucleic acid-binding protein